VERGQRLLVERLAADEGSSVALEPVLYRSDETIFDADGLGRVQVQAKIVEHLRGEKLRVFKFKPKRGYKRRTGHRQELTQIEVTEIKLSGGRARAQKAAGPAEAAAPQDAAGSTEAAAPKPAAAKPKRATKPKEADDGS
jgi:large subunit ribosomal protein L21